MEGKPEFEFKKRRPKKLYTKPEIAQVLLEPEASLLEFFRSCSLHESWQGIRVADGGTRVEGVSSTSLESVHNENCFVSSGPHFYRKARIIHAALQIKGMRL